MSSKLVTLELYIRSIQISVKETHTIHLEWVRGITIQVVIIYIGPKTVSTKEV